MEQGHPPSQHHGAMRRMKKPRVGIAGLDPAIHPLNGVIFLMDARVEPAHDEVKDRDLA